MAIRAPVDHACSFAINFMNTIKTKIKVVGFVLLIIIMILAVFLHLYDHEYLSAALQALPLILVIIIRKDLLNKLGLTRT